jgi:hypothetical protein
MAGVLSFSDYIGGPDSVVVRQQFPSDQKSVVLNFQRDITGWTFTADYQTIIVDTVKFNRTTGSPNFGESTVIGTFPLVTVSGALEPDVTNASEGTVTVTFPSQMYEGPIIPDARANVPIVIYSVTYTDTSTPPQTGSQRFAVIQAWEPEVVAGDPVLDADYTAITVGV